MEDGSQGKSSVPQTDNIPAGSSGPRSIESVKLNCPKNHSRFDGRRNFFACRGSARPGGHTGNPPTFDPHGCFGSPRPQTKISAGTFSILSSAAAPSFERSFSIDQASKGEVTFPKCIRS